MRGFKMAHAERCPICYGKGTIPDKYNTNTEHKCHGCDGKGWVSVADEPYYPYPSYYPYVPLPTTGTPYYQPTITYWCR